jgi:type II restriction/modification system DNA methylase subunit YeeA
MLPENPNGRPNADVVRPWINGKAITGRPPDKWIVDFADKPEAEAAFFEAPFDYVRLIVKPLRDKNRDRQRRENWWRLGRSGADLRAAVRPLTRYIATPRVAKHRLFVWVARTVLPDSRLNVIARDDDTTFGVLHSRFHEIWALRLGSRHGDGSDGGRPTYNPSRTFENFPFPEGLSPDRPAPSYATDPRAIAIAGAAAALVVARDRWLDPPELVRREAEMAGGFPDRLLPVSPAAAAELRKRTLTALYNVRPVWLANLHAALDAAVAAAYGWPEDISAGDVLARLLALNLARPGTGASNSAEEDEEEDT